MDIAKKIALKQKERNEHTQAMEALLSSADSEERAFTEEEQGDFDNHESMIKTIDIEIENLERMEQAVASHKAIPVTPHEPRKPNIEVKSNQDPKLFLARMAHAMYMSGDSRPDAAEYAKNIGDPELAAVLKTPVQVVNKATVASGDTGTAAWAGVLTTIQQANSAFIEMLRAASIVARFPARQMDFGGDNSIKIPRQTGGTAGSWVGENSPIAVGKLALDSITLTPKKAAIIVPSTTELLSKSNPSALQLIQDDIVQGVATTIDTLFASATAAVAGVSPAGIINGLTAITSAGNTLANVDTDLKAIQAALINANVPMVRPVWLCRPTVVNSLAHLRDGGGSKAFPEIASGMLGSYPIIASNAAPTETLTLVDASEVIIASDYMPILSISEDATLVMEGAQASVTDISSEILATTVANRIQSMYQHDAVAIRMKMAIDWALRHSGSIATLGSVTY